MLIQKTNSNKTLNFPCNEKYVTIHATNIHKNKKKYNKFNSKKIQKIHKRKNKHTKKT